MIVSITFTTRYLDRKAPVADRVENLHVRVTAEERLSS